jgi:chemotaxis response regulator CheB
VAKAVLIADDNAYIRHTLCEPFQNQPDFDVCGEAVNGKEAVEKAQKLDLT